MRIHLRTSGLRGRFWSRLLIYSTGGLLLVLGSHGCATRESTPTMSPDSTLVYPSKLKGDVSATISLTLKDSRKREEAKLQAREQQREVKQKIKELSRRKREAERDLADLKASSEKAKERAKKAADKEKTKSKKSKGKKGKKAAADAQAAAEKSSETSVQEPGKSRVGPGSLATAERRIQLLSDSLVVLQAADSLAAAEVDARVKKTQVNEQAFDLEEGARIQARIALENVYARGKRPLLIHMVWIQPNQKAAFRKVIEYVPNDSSNVLTSNLTISPDKRIPGVYRLRVFLFREPMVEKIFELRGTAESPGEGEKEDEMM